LKKLIAGTCLAAALLFPATAAGASEDAAIARVTSCPPHYTGAVVQVWQQNTGWVDLVWACIPPLAP
jgi:hypothetical protein